MEWSNWFQEIGKTAAGVWAAKETAEHAYDVQQLQLQQDRLQQQALAQYQAAQAAQSAISPTVLLIGAGLVAVLLLKGD